MKDNFLKETTAQRGVLVGVVIFYEYGTIPRHMATANKKKKN